MGRSPSSSLQDPADPFLDQYDEEVVLMLTDQRSITGNQEFELLQKVGVRLA